MFNLHWSTFERRMAIFMIQTQILHEEEFYIECIQDLQVWRLYTDLAKEKQGPVVFLSLPQNIRKCFRHLLIMDIGRAEGLKLIPDKLDEIYLWDLNTSTYMAFKDFYLYKRDNGANINDFMVRYEFLYQILQKLGITLLGEMQALFCPKCSEFVQRIWKISKDHVCNSTIKQWKRH